MIGKCTLLMTALFALVLGKVSAAAGDTLVVQTFTFGSKQDSTFKFPDKSKEYRKVLMYYTLKCNSKQNPACGEWDYLTYTYLYRHTGQYDSVVQRTDTLKDTNGTVIGIDTIWGMKERLNRFELGRYITPYGIGLDLGKGFTWVFDVSDYEPLLHDSVHLAAGNWQELLDVKFLFIEGTPARKPYKVENIWVGNFPYGTSKSIEEYLSPKKITIDPNASEVRMKVRVTGHGFGGNENCSEFCPKNHSLMVDGTQRWSKLVWRDNCASNPVFPQGGTWVYNRSNWCPGSEVQTYDIELTPYIQPGKDVTLDYNVEPYTWNGQGSLPYYATEIQLVYYEAPKYKLDAALEEIVSPSNADIHRHMNPTCGQPEVVIQNTGTTALTSLRFTYGVPGGTMQTYDWSGSLAYQEKAHVFLPLPTYSGSGFPNFQVTVSNPNGGTDENALNNTVYSSIPLAQVLPNKFVIWLRTNAVPEDNAYTLKDANGNVLYSRKDMVKNTLYRDTISLPVGGCYEFRLTDQTQDGLAWWANSAAGNGTLRFADMSGKTIKTFNADFGAEALMNFNTGWNLSLPEIKEEKRISLYPNPSNGILALDYSLCGQDKGIVNVYSITGQLVLEKNVKAGAGGELKLDLSSQPNGVYLVQFLSGDRIFSSRIILTR